MSIFSLFHVVDEFFRVHGDKRVAELNLMDSPWPMLLVAGFYVYFCYDLGPQKIMRNRQPFDLVWVVRGFNTFILLLNVWLISKFLIHYRGGLDCFGCAPVNASDRSKKSMELIGVCHVFFYSRIIELIDTLWIVLRKKNRQITFLHVFHHTFVLLMTWFYFRIAPGGSSTMFPIVNGIVHTIMYAYYTLSTFEALKPYLWWKEWVTRIQLTQFIILGIHFLVATLTPNCAYPQVLSLAGLIIACMFFTLFIAFYIETYTRDKRKSMEQTCNVKKGKGTVESQHNGSNNNNNNSNCIDRNHKMTEIKNK